MSENGRFATVFVDIWRRVGLSYAHRRKAPSPGCRAVAHVAWARGVCERTETRSGERVGGLFRF